MNSVELVKKLCKEKKIPISRLEKECGFSNGYIRGLREGKFPSDRLQQIADYLNVSIDYLLNGNIKSQKEVFNYMPKKFGTKINVYGQVAAGIPLEMIEDIIDTEEITEDLAKTGSFFGLKIKGDSMTPDICNGDVVIIRQQNDAETGDIVIATINGNEATCKRLRKYATGIELIAHNPSCKSYEFTSEEIEKIPVKIIGKVVESRRKF